MKDRLKKEIILLDGAFGTYISSLGIEDGDFGDRPGCMEHLSGACPEKIEKVHADYLEAGSDAIETNTFGANSIKLEEYGLSREVYDINLVSARLARNTADSFSTSHRRRFVIGTMGPSGKLPSSTDPGLGDISYGRLKVAFTEQARGLVDGGVDALLVETGQDLLEMKAAVNAAKDVLKEKRKDLVLAAQATLSNNGRMLLGTDISAVASTMSYLGVDVIGLNCSTGPIEMERALSILSSGPGTFISCVPNAGLPREVSGKAEYFLSPGELADILEGFLRKYRIDVLGGCCGTTPEHIKCIKNITGKVSKKIIQCTKTYASSYEAFDIDQMEAPVKIGERVNTLGSRKMKAMLMDDDYDGIVELGKGQERKGADILDVCCVLSERPTEKEDAVKISKMIAESVSIPIMIDSTDTEVIRETLENYPGTAYINSASLEGGGGKARTIYGLAKEHGSFVVNLAIGENGMARSVEEKMAIVATLCDIAFKEYKIEPHRMLFDMLTFTLGTGEEEYSGTAMDTYEAIRRIKKEYEGVLTVLGVSNVSFGLPRTARKVLNMVFLHNAVKNGLDMAIVNPAEYMPYGDIPEKERDLCEDLIFNRDPSSLECLIEYFSPKENKGSGTVPAEYKREPTDIKERLRECILERDKKRIISLSEEALKTYSAKDIINDILMDAMRTVGEKLDSGEIVLPYVIQSAETMRKAMEHLEQYLTEEMISSRGKILLATVEGDVHDIGKNLVKMILSNNGFEVIDLGKQVPVAKIISEARKNSVDAVGLSALLVSTARHMKTCVKQMHEAGLDLPVLIGGAPTSNRFAMEISRTGEGNVYSGGVFYAKDAFTGMKILQVLGDPEQKKKTLVKYYSKAVQDESLADTASDGNVGTRQGSSYVKDGIVPPFWGVRGLFDIPADEVFDLIDEDLLFKVSWNGAQSSEEKRDGLIRNEYRPLLKEFKAESIRKGWLGLKAAYGYFKCRRTGDGLDIFDEDGLLMENICFSKRRGKNSLFLPDLFTADGKKYDTVAFQAVTVGSKLRQAIKELSNSDEQTKAYLLHGLSVNLAEAVAEYVHRHIRKELELSDSAVSRYSPGYPVWSDLAEQKKIFHLLNVTDLLGVELTQDHQMVPEASTTAIVIIG